MITIGDYFPDFSMKALLPGRLGDVKASSAEDYFTTIDSKTYPGKWRVVFFWPKDFTFVCPTGIAESGRLNSGCGATNNVYYRSKHARRNGCEELRKRPAPPSHAGDLHPHRRNKVGVRALVFRHVGGQRLCVLPRRSLTGACKANMSTERITKHYESPRL